MDEPRNVTLNTTLTICGIIAVALFTAKTYFQAPVWVWLTGALWLALALVAALMLSSAAGRAYLIATLKTRKYTQVYLFVARRMNDWIWKRVGEMPFLRDGAEPPHLHQTRALRQLLDRGLQTAAAPPHETTALWPMFRRALTWRMFDRALLIAVAYPLIALILPWLLGGDAVLGAGVEVFPAAAFWPERAAGLAILILMSIGAAIPLISLFVADSVINKVGLSQPLGAWKRALLFANSGFFVYPLAVGFGLLSILFLLLGYFLWLSFAVALALSSLFGFRGLFAVAVSVGAAFVIAGTGAASFVAAGAGIVLVDYLWSRGRQGWALTVLITFWALGLLAVVLFVDADTLSVEAKAILVFLAILPLINGLFDALSYAITLALSRKGLATRWAPLYGLADLMLAAVLFLALGATMVAVIAVLNAIGSAQLYDLAALFTGLRASPEDYWWLYLILFTTLAPTALHLIVAALAVQGWVLFQQPRTRVAAWVQDAPVSHPAAVGAFLAQATIWWLPTLALAGLFWGLWQVGGTLIGAAGLFYLDRLESLALWIGAI